MGYPSYAYLSKVKSDRLSMLRVQRVRRWYKIVTLDEFWFYLSRGHEFMWLAADKKAQKGSGTMHIEKNRC
jgi:hypothetical protein